MKNVIRTVLGDIDPSQLGVTYLHEHLIIDSEIVEREFPHIHLPSAALAIAEVNLCKEVSVSAFVDCMPSGAGRNIRKLAEVSRETGTHVISVTGLHHARYYRPDDDVEMMSAEELSILFIREINNGAEGSEYKTGLIKTVTSGKEYSQREKRLFEAAAIAHKATGVPILTHCEHGTGALEQLELLQDLKVPLSSVILSHTDKETDLVYHREILNSGVFVEYDQSLRQADASSSPSAKLVLQMFEEGFGDQIMFGTDGARTSLWKAYGGTPGLFWLYSGWSKKLLAMGLDEVDLNQIFVTNPAKALSFKIAQ
jgi:predicted metal-dependent phosphotriesterase family hydrolase